MFEKVVQECRDLIEAVSRGKKRRREEILARTPGTPLHFYSNPQPDPEDPGETLPPKTPENAKILARMDKRDAMKSPTPGPKTRRGHVS